VNLTQKTVTAIELPEGKAEAIVFDNGLPGFGLRIRRGGSRSWIYQFKLGTQHRRVTLGNATALSAAQARKTATELHALVRLGRDPAGEKAEGRVRAAETMGAALQSYLPHQRARLKPRSYVEVERHLLKHCKPLHSLQLAKVDRRAVAGRIATVAAKSGAIAANRTRASLAAFFAWAIREGLLDVNPVVGTGKQPERARDRVLLSAELRVIWAATADASDYSAVVRLLMLTGQRTSEIAGLRWSEVHEDRIELAPERTKNGRRHLVPITAPVRTILEARPHRPDRDLIFGREHDRPLCGWGALKAALDQRIGKAVPHWTHHDLRRTCASRLGELGVAPHITAAILNHVSDFRGGVHGVYDRADYQVQMRHALTAWSEQLLELVEGRATPKKIVRLK
jgi:integrase